MLRTYGGGEGGERGALQNLMGGEGLKSIHGGGLKMLSKNTCEGVHLKLKLPAFILDYLSLD